MDRRNLPLLFGGIGVLLVLVSLFSPWWTLKIRSGQFELDESAGPFNPGAVVNEEMIEGSKAALAGALIVVAAVVGLAGVVLLLWAWSQPTTAPPITGIAPWLFLVAAVFPVLVSILAVTTWPNEGADFWDRETGGGGSAETYASLGWYVALAASAVLIVAGVMGLMWRTAPDASVRYARRIQ